MKKLLILILSLCTILALGVPAFAEETTAEVNEETVVLNVTYKQDGKDYSDDWTVFHKGWTDAIKKSMKPDLYSDVTVTLLADWLSDNGGQFTPDFWNDDGFNWDAIEFPEGCSITLDLNGFKIDRKLKDDELNGEVMYINEGTNVTIKNGTISGGNSSNGAGGLHMSGGNVTLIDVHFVGNRCYKDDGGGLACYGGTLTMTGGSFRDNVVYTPNIRCYGGGAYIDDGDATFINVLFENNRLSDNDTELGGGGLANGIGNITLENCVFRNNFCSAMGGAIYMFRSNLEATNCTIVNNTSESHGGGFASNQGGNATFTNCNIYDNKSDTVSNAVYHMGRNSYTKLIGCYSDFVPHVQSGKVTIIDSVSEPIDFTNAAAGTIISTGNIALIVGAVLAFVMIVVFLVKKKNK